MARTSYTARDIQVLEGLAPVRARPGMYIGGTGKEGYHHLLWEVVDNAVDEAINGYASWIQVTLRSDCRAVTVADNGRGIPVGEIKKFNKSALEVILTTLHAGGKFDQGSYVTSGGLHGVGSSVVNALSSSLVATVRRDGKEYRQEYRRGVARGPVREVGEARGSGTSIQFTPDDEIFGELSFDPDLIAERLEIKSYLSPGVRLVFRDQSRNVSREFKCEGGLKDYLSHVVDQAGTRSVLAEPFLYDRDDDGQRVHIALTWTDSAREKFISFVNGIPTRDGGTHEQGFKEGIVKAVRNYVETQNKLPRGITLTADDIREGAVGIVSLFIMEPQFQGQTKDRLNNPEVRSQVDGALRPALEQYFYNNGSVADAIVMRAIQAAKARMASRQAVQKVRRKSAVSHRLNLPGKLADCSSTDPTNSEIFIVEGDSAGGSAKQGRDRATQAILPLRGKVLNAETHSMAKVLANEELSNIVQALGCGIGKDFNADRLRYNRVILLMDADSDGHHISTLLLVFFYRYLPELIRQGYVYLAQPPLYRIQAGQKSYWAADEDEKARILEGLPGRVRPEITRFKGLGEMMPKTLFDTTLNPATRRLLQVVIPDGAQVETELVLSRLMGKDSAPRYEEIMERARTVEALDV